MIQKNETRGTKDEDFLNKIKIKIKTNESRGHSATKFVPSSSLSTKALHNCMDKKFPLRHPVPSASSNVVVSTAEVTTDNVELEEEEKLARQREEDANIVEWDDVQAMMDANYELAARLQAEKQGELTIEEKSRLFMELMNKRKKHFAKLKAEEQKRKPPTKAQKRNTMSTYLKNMAGYKHNQLKTKSFEDIQMLFDKEMKRVNTFIDMDTELVKGDETRTEGSSKRAGEELESKNLKMQKLDENVEAEVDDDQEEYKDMICNLLNMVAWRFRFEGKIVSFIEVQD
ncbi:hypothetical protein Tco_0392354, partial [Tanacetum coccineum]